MWNQYQSTANAQNNRVRRSQNVRVGQEFNPGRPYQAWADTFNNKMINSDDPSVPHHPIENMAAGSQDQADGLLNRITASDDLQLRGLGYLRRSGSMARAVRNVRGLGDGEATMDVQKSCANFDTKKWNEPIAAFLLAHPQAGQDQATKDAGTKFGAEVMTCWMYGVAAAGGIPKLITPARAEQLKAAGKKMFDNGWWAGDDWYDYWTRRSGAEPFYKNPYIIGGIGVAGIAAWLLFRKKGR
jgi:hypothetical protein